MKLTEKDRTFLETLKRLMELRDLWVELKPGQPSYMVLCGTYGEKVYRAFHMTRQGVRWRFWRIYNDIYNSAFETILSIETTFGISLREHAIQISKERYPLRQELADGGFHSADTLARETPKTENFRKSASGDTSPPGAKSPPTVSQARTAVASSAHQPRGG